MANNGIMVPSPPAQRQPKAPNHVAIRQPGGHGGSSTETTGDPSDGVPHYPPPGATGEHGSPCGLMADRGVCCPTGAFNDVSGVNETAAVGCAEDQKCADPREWWSWDCEGSENVPPILFTGAASALPAWETTSADFPRGMRDRDLARHFLRHAGWFATAPQFATASLRPDGDLVAAVAPPPLIAGVPFQTMFAAVRVDINTPYLQFAGEQLIVTVGNSPLNANSVLDNGPMIINSMNEPAVQFAPRGIVGWQKQHKISLLLPLGLVRANQTQPNVGLGVFARGLPAPWGPLIPFNVRLNGFSTGTTMKAAIVGNASAGIAQLARSV